MAANGMLLPTQRRIVAHNTDLYNPVAQAWLNLALMYKMIDGTRITPAGNYGSGYRSLAVQKVFYLAGRGDKASAEKAGLDIHSTISIAAPGYSSHGWGTRIDMLFNGHSPNEANLEFAGRYGFTREFGANDENHFEHDGKTAVHGVRSFDKLRLLGRYYNAMHIGRETRAETTGAWDADLIWLAQTYNRKTGRYPEPYLVDGIIGPHTELAIEHDWQALKGAA